MKDISNTYSTSQKDHQTDTSAQTAVILIDHGSRRQASNLLLEDVAALFRQHAPWKIVEIAHMELASPSIAEAFERCVHQGAASVVLFPYFLSPGRHWKKDIPQLAQEAAKPFPHTPYLVTAPLGAHTLITQLIQQRIQYCLQYTQQDDTPPCPYCKDDPQRCQFRSTPE